MGEKDESYFSRVLKSFEANPGVEFELLDPNQMRAKFPQLTMGPTVWGMYDPAAGIIMSDKALKLLWDNYKKLGGIIKDNCPVLKISPINQHKVQVWLEDGTKLECKSIVVCAGPWAAKMMSPLGYF